MKHPFVKSVLVLGAALALWNCGDEAASTLPVPGTGSQVTIPSENSPIVSGTSAADLVLSEPCWILNADQLYVITTKLEVFNAAGVKVGTYDPTTFSVLDVNGALLMAGVNYLELPIVDPASYNNQNTNPSITPVASSASNGSQTTPVASSASNGNQTQPAPASSASNGGQQTTPKSSASNGNQTQPAPASSASNNNQQQGSDGTCFDKVSGKNVKPYENLAGKNGESYAYAQDCSLNCYYDPAQKNCASIATSNGGNNQQQPQSSAAQPKSSSSQPKSSSSQPKSSSSQQTQNGGNTSGTISSNYTIKYVNGGKSGSGYATRYWDCCEPHCAWPEHGGKASTCDAQGNKVQGGSQSMCDGGNAGICRGQFPIVVNDQLAFAFAATPGGENNCGKCFDLAFTGKGKYATDNHKKLVGKHLIVMSSNVGYDVAGGQFDVMIPGGGYGIFNGCSQKMGWGSQGSQYGGLLDECEKETNYTASKYKSCLTSKCEKSFSGDAAAKEGCLFMANWMEAAGNPLLEYKEVECPKELIERF